MNSKTIELKLKTSIVSLSIFIILSSASFYLSNYLFSPGFYYYVILAGAFCVLLFKVFCPKLYTLIIKTDHEKIYIQDPVSSTKYCKAKLLKVKYFSFILTIIKIKIDSKELFIPIFIDSISLELYKKLRMYLLWHHPLKRN